MILVTAQLMFQGGGYGICQDGPYTLELLYQQFSKVRESRYQGYYIMLIIKDVKFTYNEIPVYQVYRQREFNIAFGEVCDKLPVHINLSA